MSVPDDTLRRVLQELQTQAITSNRAIAQTRSIITTREREKKLLQLTRNEVSSVDEVNKGEAVYRGVGKMFVQEPLKDMLSQMDKKEKELNDDVTSLNKKLTYLEKEAAQAQAGLKELFEHQKRQ